jgi:RND family efflux transporter MFP subunit
MAHFFKTIIAHKMKLIIAVIVIIVVVVGLVQFSDTRAGEPALLVTEREVSEYVQLSGEVTAADEIGLAFATAGKVATIETVQGVSVEAGEELARLESGRLDADLAQAHGSVAAAEATVAVAGATLQKAESSLALVRAQNRGIDATVVSAETTFALTKEEQATLVTNAYQELLNNDLQTYQVDAYRALTALTISGSYHADESGEYQIKFYTSGAGAGYSLRFSGLESGTVSFDDFGLPIALGTRGLFITLPTTGEGDSYGTSEWVVPVPNTRSSSYQTKLNVYNKALETQKQAVSQAGANLENLLAQQMVGEQAAITTAQEAQAQAAVAEANANLLQAQASLQQAQAQVVRVEAQLADTVIMAPFAGTIAKIDCSVGETIGVGEPVMMLVSDGGYEVRVNVPEIDIAKIDIGSEAVVTLDAYGETITWPGTVTEIELIETEVDGVPVYVSTITLNESDKRIRVGMNARARIEIQTVPQAVAVPASYILFAEEGSLVFVQNDQQVESRAVTLGLRGTDNYFVVTSGLAAGEHIVKPVSE